MKQIIYLISFLKENLPEKKLNLILNLLNKDEFVLYNTINTVNSTTDIEISKAAFNLRSSSSKYKKIKNNLQDKLFDALLFIEPKVKGANDEFTNIINAQKAAHIGNIMYSLGNVHNIVPILESKLKISNKNYIHNSTSLISSYLTSHFGFIEYDKQKFDEYKSILKKSLYNYYQELNSNLYYSIAQSNFIKKKQVDKEKFIPELEQYIALLAPLVGKVDSLIFHRNYYTLLMMVQHVNKDYEKVVDTCEILIKYIDNWPIKTFTLKKAFIRHKIEHLMLLKKYDKSIDLLSSLLSEEIEGTVGWFGTYRFMILAQINTRNLQLAYDSISIVVNSKFYPKYKTGLKYMLGFINLYLNLIGSMEFIKLHNNDAYTVKKFVKEFPNITKDKSAMNIPIIIAQLFEAIISENESDVFDRMEALKKYSSRYITKNNNTRSNCFINMLIEVVKQNYHPIAIERHTKRYLLKLNSIPQEVSSEAAEVEFIPYDYQWELLMTYLKNRKKNIRYK